MRFIAIRVGVASRLIEPKLIAPVAKRLTISPGGSTSSERHGWRSSGAFEAEQAAIVSIRSDCSLRMGEGAIAPRRDCRAPRAAASPRFRASRRDPRRGCGRHNRRRHPARSWQKIGRIAEGVKVAAHGFFGDLGWADALDAVCVPENTCRRNRRLSGRPRRRSARRNGTGRWRCPSWTSPSAARRPALMWFFLTVVVRASGRILAFLHRDDGRARWGLIAAPPRNQRAK